MHQQTAPQHSTEWASQTSLEPFLSAVTGCIRPSPLFVCHDHKPFSNVPDECM